MKCLFVPVVLIAAMLAGAAFSAERKPASHQPLRPKWSVGDRWTVKTTSRQQQAASPQPRQIVARWRFAVEAVEAIQAKPCWRIVIRPDQTPEPRTTVWVDQKTTAIEQIQTQLPTPEGYKTVTESYRSAAGSPVVGPLSVLPIALPRFPEPSVKDLDAYQYETISGPGGAKAVGEVGFSTEIRQRFSTPSAQRRKDILGRSHLKNLENGPLVEVELTTPDERVRQVWADGSPWPLLADNGTTQARLIDAARPTGQESVSTERPASGDAGDNGRATLLADDRVKTLDTGDGFEHGAARFRPWSGYWWPIREGRLLIPLGKYDRLTGHRAADWERQHNPPGANVPHWFGYCHGWAAASVLEKEPAAVRPFRLASVGVGLDVGDQKGLLTACHTEDLANSWGDRFGDGEGDDDPQDLRPDRLWRLLKLHLGQQGVPLVLDVEAGPEVWNYPVYDYELRYRPTSDGHWLADLALLMADDGVPPGYRGTKTRKQTYQFSFRMQGGNVVAGSGRWVGRSTEDHPDFAWYPYKAAASNPEVRYPKVKKLVDGSGQTPPAEPTEPVQPAPPSEPTEPAEPTEPTTTPTEPPPTTPQPVPTPPTDATPPPTGPIPPSQPGATVAPPANAAAPVVLSPIELVALIANKTSSFEFDATLDRFDGATYRSGETFFVRVKTERPGYLYLIQVDSTGAPSLLYPTAGEDNRIRPGKLVEIRPAGAARGFPVAGPAGIVRVKAVVATRPLAFSGSLERLVQDQASPARDRPSRPVQARPVQFRWHPTQWRQVKNLLSRGQSQTGAELPAGPKPHELLGPFAQDMTTFYIDAGKDVPVK